MRETPRAQQAFNDYLAMGPDRSLEKLLAGYRQRTGSDISVPTVRMSTLTTWSVQHQWQRRLANIAEQERLAIQAQGIANRQNRVDALNERWELMKQVVAERASDLGTVPGGGGTGLLVKTYKQVGSGENAQLMEEFAVDTGLLKEMREHEKQAAQELGQWTEKQAVDHQGKIGLEVDDDSARNLADIIARGIASATQASS